MTIKESIDLMREDCWDNAVHCFGTAYIFEKRAEMLKKRLTRINFLGVVVPITVGAIVISFGINFEYVGFVIAIAGILGIGQLISSIWSLAAKWDDSYAYALESTSSNYSLSNKFQSLGKNPPQEISGLKLQYELLITENQSRSQSDYKQNISDMEKRMGLRASLRNFERECNGCRRIPKSMEASDCDVCGNF
ncbi:MAG: hypothetical protein QQN41_04360 [Nitrosopumilus sp.]